MICPVEATNRAGFAEAVAAGAAHPSPIGLDLRPLTGLSAILVPTGAGDGEYPVEVEVDSGEGGVERVLSVTVRFYG